MTNTDLVREGTISITFDGSDPTAADVGYVRNPVRKETGYESQRDGSGLRRELVRVSDGSVVCCGCDGFARSVLACLRGTKERHPNIRMSDSEENGHESAKLETAMHGCASRGWENLHGDGAQQ